MGSAPSRSASVDVAVRPARRRAAKSSDVRLAGDDHRLHRRWRPSAPRTNGSTWSQVISDGGAGVGELGGEVGRPAAAGWWGRRWRRPAGSRSRAAGTAGSSGCGRRRRRPGRCRGRPASRRRRARARPSSVKVSGTSWSTNAGRSPQRRDGRPQDRADRHLAGTPATAAARAASWRSVVPGGLRRGHARPLRRGYGHHSVAQVTRAVEHRVSVRMARMSDQRTALVLGGGGITGIAWEIGVLAGLAEAGVDLSGGRPRRRHVGGLGGRRAGDLRRGARGAVRAAARAADGGEGRPGSTGRPWRATAGRCCAAAGKDVEFRRRVGALALAAEKAGATPTEQERLDVIGSPAGQHRVAGAAAGDHRRRRGDRRVPRLRPRLRRARCVQAVAASCAVPGVYPPVHHRRPPLRRRRHALGGQRRPRRTATTGSSCSRRIPRGVGPMASVDAQVDRHGVAGSPSSRRTQDSRTAIGRNVLDPAARAPSARAGRAQAATVADAGRRGLDRLRTRCATARALERRRMGKVLYSATMSLRRVHRGPGRRHVLAPPYLGPNPEIDALQRAHRRAAHRRSHLPRRRPEPGHGQGGRVQRHLDRPVVRRHAPIRPRSPVDRRRVPSPTSAAGLAAAKAAAGDDYVNILGADIARQCLELGELDEVLAIIAPVLLGDGHRRCSTTPVAGRCGWSGSAPRPRRSRRTSGCASSVTR